jgi:hypothetical protein
MQAPEWALASAIKINVKWWRMTGSNRRPPACKAGALPAELIPPSLSDIATSPIPSVFVKMVGLVGLEPTTPALSRRCSNQLSYRPFTCSCEVSARSWFNRHWIDRRADRHCAGSRSHAVCSTTADKSGRSNLSAFSRKEVIQPHLPIRLPCYDFTPVTNPAVVIALLAVRLTTSGRTRSHGVTGGVYKTRERIHRGKLIRDY